MLFTLLTNDFAGLKEGIKEETVKSVEMLGCNKKVIWEMKKDGLDILLPSCKPNMNGYVLKIEIKK